MKLDLLVDYFCTVLCSSRQAAKRRFEATQRKGAEEARNELPDLLAAAEKGRATIITRHGRAVAALVPIGAYGAAVRQPPLLPLKGSGRGLWGGNSTEAIRKMREEWNR
jgi:prevent-host-death family protein